MQYANLDLAGQRFHELVVIGPAPNRWHGKKAWIYVCDCGARGINSARALVLGTAKTCGCGKGRPKHGHARARSREYGSWMSMKARCLDSSHKNYRLYGGAGVTISERWLGDNGFATFLADMGPRPIGTSLDRFPQQNGNYEHGNCRWATPQQQMRNVSFNHLLTIGGRTMCITAWADELGVPRNRPFSRIRRGWDPIAALLAPVDNNCWRRRAELAGKRAPALSVAR